ncbi:hypothetical protein VNI00_016121 [Paramarasmius palmivorus]|uniref:Uncharacterized protein n=1 Tax=Paramarasmius palmivorus TaxID=297713 RepID=A0AAW0BH06_9AGAR
MAYRLNKPRPLISKQLIGEETPAPPKPLISRQTFYTSSFLERRRQERVGKPLFEEEAAESAVTTEERSFDGDSEYEDSNSATSGSGEYSPSSRDSTPLHEDSDETCSVSAGPRARNLATALSLPQATGVPIRKPPGEAGHPKNGGYSLEATLINVHHWSKSGYDVINSQTKGLTAELLDTTKNYKDQDQKLKQSVCNFLLQDFPFLEDYVDCWPVRDMMKAHLKHRKSPGKKRV